MNKIMTWIITLIIFALAIIWIYAGYLDYKTEISKFEILSDLSIFGSYFDNMFFKKVTIKIILVFTIALIILVINIIKLYNNMVSLKENFENALSSIEVYLKKRFDLIPNLVETVKAYSSYEKETIENIIKLRSEFYGNDKNVIDKSKLDNEYNTLITKVEAYPNLNANENFLELQKQLAKMENQIQAAIRTYNMQATTYNILIKKFPNVIVANIFKFREQALFEAKAEEKQVINFNKI